MLTLILFFLTIIIGVGVLYILHKLAQFNYLYKQMFEIHIQQQGEKKLEDVIKKVMKEPLFKPLQQYKGYVIKIVEVDRSCSQGSPYYKAFVLSNDIKAKIQEVLGPTPDIVLQKAKDWIDNTYYNDQVTQTP